MQEGNNVFGRLQVFSLGGEYLREIRGDWWGTAPSRLKCVDGRLYLLVGNDEGWDEKRAIHVLTPEGNLLQTYRDGLAQMSIDPHICPFAGRLIVLDMENNEGLADNGRIMVLMGV